MTRYFKKYSLHYRSLLAMGVPIMVGQLGVILTGFVDNIMVGHHTTAELSAASFVNNIFMLPLMFATGFAMGITPLIGEQTGRNELPQAGQIFRYGLRMEYWQHRLFSSWEHCTFFSTAWDCRKNCYR